MHLRKKDFLDEQPYLHELITPGVVLLMLEEFFGMSFLL